MILLLSGRGGFGMPHGWFVPVKGSPPDQRRAEVDRAAKQHQGDVVSFWQRHGDDGYNSLIAGVPDDEIDAFLAEPEVRPKPGHHKIEIID
jgi:hypothetical protein